jgi:hypothetical protein
MNIQSKHLLFSGLHWNFSLFSKLAWNISVFRIGNLVTSCSFHFEVMMEFPWFSHLSFYHWILQNLQDYASVFYLKDYASHPLNKKGVLEGLI